MFNPKHFDSIARNNFIETNCKSHVNGVWIQDNSYRSFQAEYIVGAMEILKKKNQNKKLQRQLWSKVQ